MRQGQEIRFQKALEYIADGLGIEKACHQAGISTKTFYKLKTTPKHAENYKRAREKGFIACGMDLEKATEWAEKEGKGFRIEKPHMEKAIGKCTIQFFLDEKGEKTISNALERQFSALEKAFKIVENGKEAIFLDVLNNPSRFKALYNLLWEIQHSTNTISKIMELFKEAQPTQQSNGQT